MKTSCCRNLFRLLSAVIIIVSVSISGNSLYGQEEDFNLWTELDLKIELNKRLDLEFSIANRLENNASRRDETLAEMGLEYGKKWFSAGIKYRFMNENDPEGNYDIGHRFTGEFSLETEFDRFELSMRNRIQTQYMNVNSSESGRIPETYYRNRMKLEYNINDLPLNPYGYFELYYRTNKYTVREIEKNRVSFGMEYEISKRHDISAGYIYEYRGLGPLAEKKHVVEIEYCLNL